jgi:membrane-bound metal-dependent hydrolase YbcI (DUF457 family)
MSTPTHLIAGFVVGAITGDYVPAIAVSVLIDFDHTFSFIKNGIIFKPKKLWKAMTTGEPDNAYQRGIFHSVIVYGSIVALLFYLQFQDALSISLSYFLHLFLDVLDSSVYFPFYPSQKMRLEGKVKYFSKSELYFAVPLLIVGILILYFR